MRTCTSVSCLFGSNALRVLLAAWHRCCCLPHTGYGGCPVSIACCVYVSATYPVSQCISRQGCCCRRSFVHRFILGAYCSQGAFEYFRTASTLSTLSLYMYSSLSTAAAVVVVSLTTCSIHGYPNMIWMPSAGKAKKQAAAHSVLLPSDAAAAVPQGINKPSVQPAYSIIELHDLSHLLGVRSRI